MKLHSDIRFSVVAVTAFALVAVLLPMSMVMTGCHMMMMDALAPVVDAPVFSGLCTMVQDPSLPDALGGGGGLLAFIALLAALFVAFAAVSLPVPAPARAVVPVAASPPPPPESPLGVRLRL